MIQTVKQGLEAEGVTVAMTKLCQWFEVPRRSFYYKPTKSAPEVQERLERPIRALIEQDPSYGYRTVAGLLNMNKNTVQRIFQIRVWQVKKLPIGFRPRLEALPSVAGTPDQHWTTDFCRTWASREGWVALEQGLTARFGTLGQAQQPLLLHSKNGLVFASRCFEVLVRRYGLQKEFITPHCPRQNEMVERVIRTSKEQCVHRQRFETLQHANRVISDWIGFYNQLWPHQALGMKTPTQTSQS